MVKRRFRKCFDKRALTPVISSIIMASIVIALSFAVLVWTQFRTSDYAETYGEKTDEEIARLKERLTVEHIFYHDFNNKITIYLLNYGTIEVNITRVSIMREQDGYNKSFEITTLTLLGEGSGTTADYLPSNREGCIRFDYGESLTEGKYFVSIKTERGNSFDSEFEA